MKVMCKFLSFWMVVCVFASSIIVNAAVVQYKDVLSTNWYYNDVSFLGDRGIVKGYRDGTFKPNNNVTNAEALTIIVKAANLTMAGIEATSQSLSNTSQEAIATVAVSPKWYDETVRLASYYDVLQEQDKDMNAQASRQDVAVWIARAFNIQTAATPIAFRDTQSAEVANLATLGIVKGTPKVDGYYFNPKNKITRAEITAITARAVKNNEGISVAQSNTPVVPELNNIEPKVTKPVNLQNEADLVNLFLYICKNDLTSYDVIIKNSKLSSSELEANFKKNVEPLFSNAITKASLGYPDYFDNIEFEYQTYFVNSNFHVKFSVKPVNHMTYKQVIENRNKVFNQQKLTIIDLYKSETLKIGMSEKERAEVIFKWICNHCKYDTDLTYVGVTSYGLFFNHSATSLGYNSTFVSLCQLVGVKACPIMGQVTIENEDYIVFWTKLYLPNEVGYVDVVYGDSSDVDGLYSYDYFMASQSFMDSFYRAEIEFKEY